MDNSLSAATHTLAIPPMLIQPFIENAIWHGLRYKDARGFLKVSLTEDNNNLVITVTDDGIGRKRSLTEKTKHQKLYKSTGMNNVKERMTLLNEIHETNYKIEINDLDPSAVDTGTVVTIRIPKR